VTVVTSGAGFSTTAVSTAGAEGRTSFVTVPRLDLAFATVRFVVADFASLRALPRLAKFPFRGFARFCTFDPFLRLAMIVPRCGWYFATH
jgi:hypothetical protein